MILHKSFKSKWICVLSDVTDNLPALVLHFLQTTATYCHSGTQCAWSGYFVCEFSGLLTRWQHDVGVLCLRAAADGIFRITQRNPSRQDCLRE